MFIEIDESCIELLKQDKYIVFFNELAYNIYKGKNYVFLSKEMLEKLYNNDNIDLTPKKIYKDVFNNSSTDMIVKNSVSRSVIVTSENGKTIKHNNDKIVIPIDVAININLFSNRPNLICENISDCKFLYNIGELYKIKNSIKSINIELENTNGGGDTITDIYKEKNRIKELSLVIVDSDQRYESAPIGATLKKILREQEDGICEIYPLYVHEIENLIPIKMIENYYKNARTEEQRENVINFLKSFKVTDFKKSPIAFFDMKKGITLKKWREDERYRSYWRSNLASIGYEYSEEKEIINGFGDHLLRKINNHMERVSKNEDFFEKNVDEFMIDIWNELGKIIYSYGCARTIKYCL